MNSIKEQVDMFELSMGKSPGGHPRAYNWWLDIANLAAAAAGTPDPSGYDDSIESLDLDRPGHLALAKYAVLRGDYVMLLNVCVAGAASEALHIAQKLTVGTPRASVEG